jgi:hypothetical protein
MTNDDFMVFSGEPQARLELSRRLREVLVDGLLADGASQADLESEGPLLTQIAGRFVDALGLQVSPDGTTLRVLRR